MRSSVRVAALSHLPINYIWTHDSIGVGEDGPTHQPVETVSSLRLIPNLDVMRPGDAEETAGAYIHGMNRKGGPTAYILSRQDLPVLTEMSAADKRAGTMKGAYTIVKETAELTNVILAAGSELHAAYKAEVLPNKAITTAFEAGATGLWYKYADKVLGVDSFGESAPAPQVFEVKGITKDNLVKVVKA